MTQASPPTDDGLGFARASISRSVKSFLARYPQLDADRLLLNAGLRPTTLGDREATHTVRSILKFLENGAKETGDDCFALELTTHLPIKDLDVLGYVLLNSPTMGAGLENLCRYYAVQQTLAKLSLIRGAADARVTCMLSVPRSVDANQYFILFLGMIVKYCREATGQREWCPGEVRFMNDAPADPSRLEQYFGAPVRFRQPENALSFPLADLDRPLHSADPALLPILQGHADDLLAKLPTTGDFMTVVRRQITELLSIGDVAIEDTAARLQLTPRSLQRRLQESGTSFLELLGEIRLALARRYLDDPALTLTEIAFLLGYSDLSAFSRAFRRWTDQTPLEFRRRTA